MKGFSLLKNGFYISLLLSLAVLSCKGEEADSAELKKIQKKSVGIAINKSRKITVFYFHTKFRCSSCVKIEKFTKQALLSNFSKEMKSGRIIFKPVNVEKIKNKHFIQDYQLFTKTVVLVDFINGKKKRWKRLDQTWSYLRNPGIFDKYIEDEVTSFINNKV